LRFAVHTWTSVNGRGTFSNVTAVLDNGTQETLLTLPTADELALVHASTRRWQGWIQLLNNPRTPPVLPAGITVQQRFLLRGLANTLLYFAASPPDDLTEERWRRFMTFTTAVTQAGGEPGEVLLERVLEWVWTE
ncbi:hypothetical protein C8Q78DRAFT_958085, partial [Trametes maxima]